MFGFFVYMLEVRKEVLIGLSLCVIYITYYLVEVVKKPKLVCGTGEFRALLEALPLVRERYWPTPWCVEARLQTVLGSLLRTWLLRPPPFRREILRLSDGGQVALDWLDAEQADAPVLLILPGITGDSQTDYVRCLCAAAQQLGAHAVVFNNPARVHAALVMSPPLDVEASVACMDRALTVPLVRHLAASMRHTVSQHPLLKRECDWPRVNRARSLREFDVAFTANHFGYKSVEEYYLAATLRGKLARVRAPLLCLCAADDPFQPEDVLPHGEAAASKHVALLVTARGGHIGFLEGWWPAHAARTQYIARLARQYFAALLREPSLLHTPTNTSSRA
ncbi:phospholipase ABHD3 [Phthorimaea operculella]|nr:phospholipase ABHD3 [Phthorimaea operculella]